MMAVRRGAGTVLDKVLREGILRWHLIRDLKEVKIIFMQVPGKSVPC